ncbi:hypothetical protein SAMN06265182_0212 [Persephonella hydrogeniphila]|uniref:DUF501 domain-containing protein n=1 Tax=Persephonella hydrogeniphila TaxID=198703 RepID=A0A285N1J6_9AQUI|nr:DUF501 domain-containing protein [Persephonella hydrogeniphila]SNZ02793.1 hypothetical protein SAMN06265182_0212 [Persephonella hydrogeniphila]
MKSTDKVVENPPVIFDKKKKIFIPQPTRFWILDKELRKKISRLEEKGWIQKWEKKVTNDEKLFRFFISLHKKEIERRKKFLEEKEYPEYIIKKLLNTGIGGIESYNQKPFKVKCLHLWTAYHLGDPEFENPIGEWVLKEINKL